MIACASAANSAASAGFRCPACYAHFDEDFAFALRSIHAAAVNRSHYVDDYPRAGQRKAGGGFCVARHDLNLSRRIGSPMPVLFTATLAQIQKSWKILAR